MTHFLPLKPMTQGIVWIWIEMATFVDDQLINHQFFGGPIAGRSASLRGRGASSGAPAKEAEVDEVDEADEVWRREVCGGLRQGRDDHPFLETSRRFFGNFG